MVEKAELVQVCFTLRLTEYISECKMDVKSTCMDSYITSYGSCFTVTWIIFKNHLLEVGLPWNQETMALRMPTTIELYYFCHVWGPAMIQIHWTIIELMLRPHMTSHNNWRFVTTLHDFEGVLKQLLDNFFWALTISWSRLLACVKSGLSISNSKCEIYLSWKKISHNLWQEVAVKFKLVATIEQLEVLISDLSYNMQVPTHVPMSTITSPCTFPCPQSCSRARSHVPIRPKCTCFAILGLPKVLKCLIQCFMWTSLRPNWLILVKCIRVMQNSGFHPSLREFVLGIVCWGLLWNCERNSLICDYIFLERVLGSKTWFAYGICLPKSWISICKVDFVRPF